MPDNQNAVLAHHAPAARMWGLGGAAYDGVSFRISDALSHTAQRLDPRPGEAILDIATGTGWSARNVAAVGARVTAIDIASDLLDAARSLSAGIEPSIDFRLADAEQLPFDDGVFDGIISTFGVIFAANQSQAAAEMARVCCPGGRIALAAWSPGAAVDEFFGLIAKHGNAPPPPSSPLAWGDPETVRGLLGQSFDLRFEPGVSHAYHPHVDQIWDWYVKGFGPLRALVLSLDDGQQRALKADIDAYHSRYETDFGLHIKRDYVVVMGQRR